MAKKRRITVASAKAKARNLQNWTGQQVSRVTGITFGKDEDIEGRPMGQAGTDIILHGDALKIFPFDVECKNQERWSLNAWIKQARAGSKKQGRFWLIIAKNKSMKAPVAILDARIFFRVARPFIQRRKGDR